MGGKIRLEVWSKGYTETAIWMPKEKEFEEILLKAGTVKSMKDGEEVIEILPERD